MVQVSKPRSANHSIAEECARPGTWRSKVGCEAIDEPCTKRMVPRALPAGACLFQRKSLMSPFRVQCSVPFIVARSFRRGRKARFYARIRRPKGEDAGGRRRKRRTQLEEETRMAIDIGTLDTFPKLLMHHARERGGKPAIREKDLGIWQTWTWSRFAEEVRSLACGLAAQGLKRGEHIALVGDNRPRIYAAMCAAQCLGAIPVPLYQDAVAAEMAYPIQNAQIAYAVVEDQEQVDKLLEILPQCPTLKHIYYDDPRGLRHYAQPEVASYESLIQAKVDAAFLDGEIAKGRGSDTAAMFFTSGTTGTAKGVVLTHMALIDRAKAAAEMEGLGDDDVALAYLPPAWIGQNIFSYAQPFVTGYCICCPESAETVMRDMREIGPTYYFAPPRVLEALLTQVSIRMEDAGPVSRFFYRYFMEGAGRVGGAILARQPVGALDRLRYWLGDLSTYGPLRNVLGMS